jgi:hypothetical protein
MLAEILSVLTATDTIHAAMRAIVPGYGHQGLLRLGISMQPFWHPVAEQRAIVRCPKCSSGTPA